MKRSIFKTRINNLKEIGREIPITSADALIRQTLVITNEKYLFLLNGLFFYVDRLVNKKTEQKVAPLWIANVIFLILIVTTIIGWYAGVAEKRNVRIENSVTEIENIEKVMIDDSIVEDG